MPFNRLDQCGRFTVALTALLGLVAAATGGSGLLMLLVTLANALNAVVMGLLILSSTKKFQKVGLCLLLSGSHLFSLIPPKR